MSDAAIEAARAIRLAAHALSHACAIAIGDTADTIGQSTRGLTRQQPDAPRPIEEEEI